MAPEWAQDGKQDGIANKERKKDEGKITARVHTASIPRGATRAQANHPGLSLPPRYSNIGYGNKLRIDLEAGFTPATAG